MRMHDATMVMSGGSRGIGLAIAVAAARPGANIVLLAKTDQPDPRLPGTIHSAAEAITAAGGQALPVVGDARREQDVAHAAAAAVGHRQVIWECLWLSRCERFDSGI